MAGWLPPARVLREIQGCVVNMPTSLASACSLTQLRVSVLQGLPHRPLQELLLLYQSSFSQQRRTGGSITGLDLMQL